MLIFQRVLKKGSKGKDVETLQKALNELGYFCGIPDGIWGNGTNAQVLLFQKKNNLIADGIFGQASHNRINEVLQSVGGQSPVETPKVTTPTPPTNKPKYYQAYGAYVLEVDPLDLYVEVVKKAGSSISGNFINGSLFGNYKGKMVSISTLVSNGKILAEHLPHDNVKRGTLVVYKDGTVAVEMIDFISKFPRLGEVKFAIGGFNIMPVGKTVQQELKDEWFEFKTVGYRTWRSMLGVNKSTNKVLIVIAPNTDAVQGHALMKKLGCDIAISNDSGGSCSGRFNNKLIRNTSRVLHNIVRW